MISGYILSGGERRTLFAEGMPGAEIAACTVESGMNQVDSAALELPASNLAAKSLLQKNAVIEIRSDGAVVFLGEVAKPTQTIFGGVRANLDGPLGWLQNICKAPFSITAGSANKAAADFLAAILDQYNAGAEDERMVQLGVVTVTGDVEMDHSGEYTRTLDLFRECHKQLGGYYYTTYSGGIPKVHYVAAPSDYAGQALTVGVNVLTLEKQLDFTEYASRVYATGTDEGGNLITQVVINREAERAFGRVDYPLKTSEKTPGGVKSAAQKELDARSAPIQTLQLTAADLEDVGADFRAFQLGTVARCYCTALGIDVQMMVQSIKRDYINKTKSVVTFGKSPRTLTGMMN